MPSARLQLAFLFLSGVTAYHLSAQTFQTLKSFGSNSGLPSSTMVEVSPGLFYGTTAAGGTRTGGSIFSITGAGVFKPLSSFTSATGDYPTGQLVQGADGQLYGTTLGNGVESDVPESKPLSVLFRSDLAGNITVLVDFSRLNIGAAATPLTAGADGALYGAVGFFNFPNATGLIYRYTLDGTFTILHAFGEVSNYMNPLVQASDGNLYGVVPLGSDANVYSEIYRVSPGGDYTPLLQHHFSLSTLLTQGANGKLYGVDGYYFDNPGEAFSLNLDGSGYTVLASFGATPRDCANEFTALTLASDGGLYGGCAGGFANNYGGIFRITSQDVYQQIYSFTASEGTDPSSTSGLAVQGTNGVFYGELFTGLNLNAPPYQNGSLYAFDAALPKPLPDTRVLTPSTGSAGTSVLVFGSGFLQTSSVSFNGVPAPFTVQSSIYIETTVPAGATTGPITITTNNGTTTSSAIFTVN